jgi:hypothetical protein
MKCQSTAAHIPIQWQLTDVLYYSNQEPMLAYAIDLMFRAKRPQSYLHLVGSILYSVSTTVCIESRSKKKQTLKPTRRRLRSVLTIVDIFAGI